MTASRPTAPTAPRIALLADLNIDLVVSNVLPHHLSALHYDVEPLFRVQLTDIESGSSVDFARTAKDSGQYRRDPGTTEDLVDQRPVLAVTSMNEKPDPCEAAGNLEIQNQVSDSDLRSDFGRAGDGRAALVPHPVIADSINKLTGAAF
ncbi:hypothetical protein [Kibdelosporangium aridum]|uniref:hypothetical protein n=1 Tax=Kibdelosporangium aridum TaxID=2030 RepID=UPI000527C582